MHDARSARSGERRHTAVAACLCALVWVACGVAEGDPVEPEPETGPPRSAERSAPSIAPARVDIDQDAATGAFKPFNAGIRRKKDVIVWHFPTESPGNSVVRRLSQPKPTATWQIAPYEPTLSNELAGPMIQAPSGVFALGPAGLALKEQPTPCAADTFVARRPPTGPPTSFLCRDPNVANKGRPMASTWADPDITGVFLRMQWKDFQPSLTTWKDGEGDFLATEADKAVQNGKLFSVMLESGKDGQPDWLLTPIASGGAGLAPLTLVWNDEIDHAPGTHCGVEDQANYVDPTSSLDAGAGTYLDLYKAALTRVADVLKRKSSRFRALAYVKPSGANRATGENRLPTRCRAGCLCNNYAWARAGYTSSKLYSFYSAQLDHISRQFPNKSMSYMSIPSGFPRVGLGGCWDGVDGPVCPLPTPADTSVPLGEEQTDTIIANAFSAPATSGQGMFIVEYQGLDPRPESVNGQVENAAAMGRPTMYQTSAGGQVGSPAQLGETLAVLYDHSLASALEIYEERLWEANGLPLGSPPDYAGLTIGKWNTKLHKRRGKNYPALGDPAPKTYEFTLGAPVVLTSNTYEYYMDPRYTKSTEAGCNNGFSPCIIIAP